MSTFNNMLAIFSVILFYSANAFDPNATKYVFVREMEVLRGTGDGQFMRIHDIDFNPSETRLYANR